MNELGLTRRRWLGGVLAGVGASLVGCDGRPRAGALGAMERVNERVQGWLLGGGAAHRPGDGELTPVGRFPSYHASPFPPAAPAGWVLAVGGMVARPRMLSLDDLMRLPRTDMRVEHHCVEGWSAVADWHGVKLSEIAALAGADRRAGFVDFRTFDAGYWSSWDRESAMHPQTLIAYGMNGRPLVASQGAPARLYGSVKLGYKQVKYLTAVTFLDHQTGGYWENTGYEWFAGT